MSLKQILTQVAEGTLSVEEAEQRIRQEAAPRTRHHIPRLVALLFLGIGSLFAAIGIGIGIWSWTFASGAHEVEGTVIRLVRSGSKGGTSPVVRYQVDGQGFEFQSSISTSPPAYSLGEKVIVLYRPEQPGKGRINSFTELWLFPLIFGGGGTLFVAVGLGLLLARARAKSSGPPPEPPTEEGRGA